MAGRVKARIRTQEIKHQHQHVEVVQSMQIHTGRRGCPSPPHDSPPSFVIPPNCGDLARNLPTMSTKWKDLPFAFPTNEENHKKINEILTYSFEQQKHHSVSDNAAFVSLVVSQCLTAVGIDNVVTYGFRTVEGDSFPHVWLIIQGHTIDNTYIKEMQEHRTQYLIKETPHCYEQSEFVYPEIQRPPPKPNTPLDTVEMSNTLTKKRIDFYMQNPNGALALGLNREQSYNYFFSMTKHMYDVYKASVKGIDPKIRFICWTCWKFPKRGMNFLTDILSPDVPTTQAEDRNKLTWKFSQCSACMVANYCSEECQKRDWFCIHSIVCLSRGSDYLPPIGDIPFKPDPGN